MAEVLHGAPGSLRREAAVTVGSAGAGAVACVALVVGENVVLARLDGLRPENLVQLVPVRGLFGPLAHRVEHVALDLDGVVAQRRVVEGPQNIVDHLVNGDAWVLPRIQNSASSPGRVSMTTREANETQGLGLEDLRDDILKNRSGNPASTGVQDIREMVL